MFKECDETLICIFLSVFPDQCLYSRVHRCTSQYIKNDIITPGSLLPLELKTDEVAHISWSSPLLCFSVFHPRAAHFQWCDFLIFLINYSDIYCVYSDSCVLCINQPIPISFSSMLFAYWFWLGRRKPRAEYSAFLATQRKLCRARYLKGAAGTIPLRQRWYQTVD